MSSWSINDLWVIYSCCANNMLESIATNSVSELHGDLVSKGALRRTGERKSTRYGLAITDP